jgi:hypothetical protein
MCGVGTFVITITLIQRGNEWNVFSNLEYNTECPVTENERFRILLLRSCPVTNVVQLSTVKELRIKIKTI